MDYEKIVTEEEPVPIFKKNKKRTHKLQDRDDLSGMMLNMAKKVDAREMFIIWIVFLFLHTEMFCEHVLKRCSGATNDDNTMTMKGTFYASFIMIAIVLLCSIVF
jgi:hypothetical protein